MDLYGVSIGVQEVLFYLIKVYGFKMGFRTNCFCLTHIIHLKYSIKEKERGYVSNWQWTVSDKGSGGSFL